VKDVAQKLQSAAISEGCEMASLSETGEQVISGKSQESALLVKDVTQMSHCAAISRR
jgi:hypothetical protein